MKKMCLLLVGLLVFSGVTTMSYVVLYPGVEFYNGDLTVGFSNSDGVNVSYLEVGDGYVVLGEMNLSLVCSGAVEINVSQANSAGVVSRGTSVLRFNTTFTGASVVFTFTGNNTRGIYKLFTDSVLTSSDEANSFSWTHSSWSTHDFDIVLDDYRPDCPTNGSSNYNVTSHYINITWTAGTSADASVVLRRNDTYPTSISDSSAYIVQNSSITYYNASLTSTGYFSVWSYNSTTGAFSLNSCKEDIEWGAIVVYAVFNKSRPSQGISPFGILISNEDGTDTYWNSTASAPLFISKDNIPFGDDTIITINASGYKSSQYYYDFELNNFYNLTFYLSPTLTHTPGEGDDPTGDDTETNYTSTHLYRIRVIDTYQNPIPDVHVNVKFYANTTDTYENTSILLTDGYGEADVYLVPNTNYKVFLTKSGYSQTGSKDWIPDPIFYGANYPKIFQMNTASGEDITIWTGVNWSIEPTIYDHYANFTMYFNITSENDDLEWFKAVVYLWDSSSETWMTLYSETVTTSSGGSISYTTVNGTGKYALECSFKREEYDSYNFGTPHSNEKYVFNIWGSGGSGLAGLSLDEAITGTVGLSPVYVGETIVVYSSLIGCFIAMIILFTFSPKYAGFAIIVLGIVIGAFKQPLNLISDDVINFGAAAMIIILGVITIYVTKKRE